MIEGVVTGQLNESRDDRGSFAEVVRASAFPVAQMNLSHSDRNVLRGMHYHQHQTDLWVAIDGSAEVHLVDLRERQPPMVFWLYAGWTLRIPPGVAHGFWSMHSFSLLYAVDREYDGTDEYEFTWVDPATGIWRAPDDPVMSHRDQVAPFLPEVLQYGLYARRQDR